MNLTLTELNKNTLNVLCAYSLTSFGCFYSIIIGLININSIKYEQNSFFFLKKKAELWLADSGLNRFRSALVACLLPWYRASLATSLIGWWLCDTVAVPGRYFQLEQDDWGYTLLK